MDSGGSVSPNGSPPSDGLSGGPARPEFSYNATEAQFVIIFGAFMSAIATISVLARLYSRYFFANHVGLDDFMAIGSLCATIVVNVLQSVYAAVYLPQENGFAPPSGESAKLFYVIKIIYTMGVAFYKLTFLIQFWRIFRYIYYMRILYIVAIVLISGWSISQILVTIMTCLPIWSNWEPIDPTSAQNIVCLPVWVSTYLNAGGTVLTDLIVLLLPVPTLLSLKLRRSQKWAAVGIFGIGGIVPIISAGRIWSLGIAPPNGFVAQACFNTAELSAGVITAGLATIRLLISRHLSSTTLSTLRSRGEASRMDGHWAPSLRRKISLTFNSKIDDTQLSSRDGDPEHYDMSNMLGGASSRRDQMNMGNRATVTAERYDRPMSDGGAEFLKEFGIIVELNWEVTETIIEMR
ncbi:hypothetical protein PFICI_08456 [Pestalotiopsis fici W106-1]|uniref:Rhodopsin domain-containing protein n=1 Tax=Pestalotiopsis fici (strain W106-1 / CGMCC3.15140) TaxID=1229662 RepID=W3X6B2_PESFW|nr:uncharacterized protein PFICI_08456 [Pestalotiopsis fici W106-1]ETS80927.1 hypothetical protein PFICI_08456 [Pestalotiopsis fici W106-1]